MSAASASRQRREVAARPDRPAARHLRDEPPVQAREQQLDRLDPRAGEALGERVRPQQHRRADDLVRVGVADSAGMAAQETELELAGQVFRDRLRDEPAEARVDPVGVLARAVRRAVDQVAGRPHALAGRVSEPGLIAFDRDRPHVLDRQAFARQLAPAHGVRV